MDQLGISLTIRRDLIEDLSELARREGLAVSKPRIGDATDTSLRAPIGPGEAHQIFATVSVILSAATAAVTFIDKIIDLVKKHDNAPVEIRDAKTGRKLVVIQRTTDASKVKTALRVRK